MRTKIRTTWLLSSAIALLGLTACAANSSTPGHPRRSATSGCPLASSGAARTVARFDGSTFVATEVAGAHTIVPGSTITLAFESGSLSATAGCNYMSGPYTLAGNVLSAPQLATTVMGCDHGLMGQDRWLAAFLNSSPAWTFENDILTLANGTDTIVMTLAPSGAKALTTTGWKLVLLISPRKYEPLDRGVRAWVRFNGGEVAFDTSCNRGGGSAEVTDESITFGALSSTAMACDGARGETERAMTAVMAGTTEYRLQDPSNSTLTITAQDGANALHFSADPTVGADAFGGASGSASAGGTASPTS